MLFLAFNLIRILFLKTTTFNLKSVSNFLKDFLLTLKDIDDEKKYETFMNHSINTIDSYGVASGLMEVLCSVYKFMDMEFVYELADILYKMFTPNIQLLPGYYNKYSVFHLYY